MRSYRRVTLELSERGWCMQVDLVDAQDRHVRVCASEQEVNLYEGERFELLEFLMRRHGDEFGDLAKAFLREIRRA